MNPIRHLIGIDISTQTVSAILIGVLESDSRPVELIISSAWVESLPCRDEISRKSVDVWVDLVRDCIRRLKRKAKEAEVAEAIGISTTFPGCFTILRDGRIDPRFVSLYDNTNDAGICGGSYDIELGRAESETCNRMWPGNMAIGLAHLMRSMGLTLDMAAGVVPPNTAFAHQLLRSAGYDGGCGELVTDFSHLGISGLYDARSGEPVPPGVADLLEKAVPGIDIGMLKNLLAKPVPSWRNCVPAGAMPALRKLLGLQELKSVSVGAGDSPLGALALLSDRDTIINVRGSSDSPMIVIDSPKPHLGTREVVLHYPMPTAVGLNDAPWCVVAPMLRSGRVWDWVRGLRFDIDDPTADEALENLALQAAQKEDRLPVVFDTALGGERAPNWDAAASGALTGLVESHQIGDIALAALEGMSRTLGDCIKLMEQRYESSHEKMLLVGGPAKNALWNWITQQQTGKKIYATTFSDASLLGAALLGYGAMYDGCETDDLVAGRLKALSKLSARHELVAPLPIKSPIA